MAAGIKLAHLGKGGGEECDFFSGRRSCFCSLKERPMGMNSFSNWISWELNRIALIPVLYTVLFGIWRRWACSILFGMMIVKGLKGESIRSIRWGLEN
jgi:hypothetical protein